MKKVIWGTSILAELLAHFLEREEDEVFAFVVDAQYRTSREWMGKPVLTPEELLAANDPGELGAYVCIGYGGMNAGRKKAFGVLEGAGIKPLTYIHPDARVYADYVGPGCLIFEGATVGPLARIGKGNILYPNSLIAHHSAAGDFNFFSISSSIAGCVTIGDECFFGNNCATRDHISIGSRVLVGASAYLARDAADGSVYRAPRAVLIEGKTSTDYL